ncbi:UNVERIFIED_CONTAM: hypothetical protein HHA_287040 [Hammondia hammondi]|eukprot:XP_008884074.1 hypothetical protein HHA_287040 [Hammondia hammondi]
MFNVSRVSLFWPASPTSFFSSAFATVPVLRVSLNPIFKYQLPNMKLASVTVAVAVAILGSGSATAEMHCANGGRFVERLGGCIPREICQNNSCGEPSSYITCGVAPSGTRMCTCAEGFENRQTDGNEQCHRIPGSPPPTVEPVPEPEGNGEAGEGPAQPNVPQGGETSEPEVESESGETGDVESESGETGDIESESGETGDIESESGETGESSGGSEESCNGECEEETEGDEIPESEGHPEENVPEAEPSVPSAPVLEKIEFMDQAILKVMATAAPSHIQVRISECFTVSFDRAGKTVTVANSSTSHSGRMAGAPSLTGGFVALFYHDGQNFAVIFDYQQETGNYGNVTVNVPFGQCGLDIVSIEAKSHDAEFEGLHAFVTADLKQRMSA